MPKFPKPFYRTARKAWFVQVGRKQVNLGPDEAEALRRYHEVMSARRSVARPVSSEAVLAVLDAFLDWCEANKAGRTYDWYRNYLESFAGAIPRGLTVDDLKPFHVQAWLDDNPTWKTGKRGAVIAVQRVFNWAVKMGRIPANPVKGMEKPEGGRREHVISDEEFRTMLGLVKDQEFRDLLLVCWETGCRPQEIVAVEARHVDLEKGCWTFFVVESKGKRRKRVVYLTDGAVEICRRLTTKHPGGKLFRNTDAMPWGPSALKSRFSRLRLTTGRMKLEAEGRTPPKLKRLTAAQRADTAVRTAHTRAVRERRREVARLAMRLVPRYSLYTLRHSWCTHALERGVDAVTVASLMGHRDTTMISRVYAHLLQRPDHLKNALRKAAGA